MPQTLVDLLIERKKEEEKYFQNYQRWAKVIKKEARKLLGEVKVFIFGSILRKEELPRDIDILIISPKLNTLRKKSKTRAELLKRTNLSYPFEIHLITPEEYRNWYRNFIKEKVEI